MPNVIAQGTTAEIPTDGTQLPAGSENTWEVVKSGALLGSSSTPSGYDVAPTGIYGSGPMQVTVPASAPIGTGYQARARVTGAEGQVGVSAIFEVVVGMPAPKIRGEARVTAGVSEIRIVEVE